jgi:hypothetical protein
MTIRFDADCFEIVGYRTVYTVVLSAPRYPARFDSQQEAEEFARKRNRVVTISQEPIRRRVSN